MFGLVTALDLALVIVAALFVVPTTMLMVQCVVGSFPRRTTRVPSLRMDGHSDSTVRPSVDLLIPAHDEESVIATTLQSLIPQLRQGDRMLVVADNCSDKTASIARSLGADVVERFDDNHRAKGYAVAFGLQKLHDDMRDVVVMVDADCVVSEGAIDRLARMALLKNRPVQANYQMPASVGGGAWGAVSGFATTVKNQVRPLGLHRLGYGCVLYGSGMAFPSKLASRPNWASDNIVEDMKVSYDFMVAGYPPHYCPEAIVRAGLPDARADAIEQRKRWEHGHLHTIATQTPRLLGRAVTLVRPSLIVAALDLMIPPLALLVQCWVVATIAMIAVTALTSASAVPLALMVLAGINLAIGVLTAWFVHGREQLTARQLCAVPVYLLSKFPLYVSAIFRRQRTWRRTNRGAGDGACA